MRESRDEKNTRLEELLADRLAEECAAGKPGDKVKEGICNELEELLQEERPDWFRDEVGALRKRWQESGRDSRGSFKQLEQRAGRA